MSDPTPYVPGYDFTSSDKGVRLNVELANVAEATEQLAEAIGDIRRADGRLKNRIVTADSLDPTAIAALGADGAIVAEAIAAAEAAAATAAAEAAQADVSATAAAASVAAATAAQGAAATSASAADGSAVAAAASAVQAQAWALEVLVGKDKFSVYSLTNITGIASATATKLVLTSGYNRGDAYDFETGRWRPQISGTFSVVRVSLTVLFTGGVVAGSQYRAMIYKNGALVKQAIVVASSTTSVSVSVTALIEASFGEFDYFEAFVQGDGAGTKTVSGNIANTWFEGEVL